MLRIGSRSPESEQNQLRTCPHQIEPDGSFHNARIDKPVRIYKRADCHKLTWDD